LTGLVAGSYSFNGGPAVTVATTYGIPESWLGTTLRIVKLGNGTTTTDSLEQSLSIPARPAAPTTPAGGIRQITGVTSAMEYKLSTASSWIAITGTTVTGLNAGTYDVRTRATLNAFASSVRSAVVTTTVEPVFDYAEVLPGFSKNLQGGNNNNFRFTVRVYFSDTTYIDELKIVSINGGQKGNRTFDYGNYSVYVAWNDNNTVTTCEVRTINVASASVSAKVTGNGNSRNVEITVNDSISSTTQIYDYKNGQSSGIYTVGDYNVRIDFSGNAVKTATIIN